MRKRFSVRFGAATISCCCIVCSGPSDESVPDTPADLTVVNVDSVSVRLSWTDASDNETGFRINRRSYLTGIDTTIIIASANTTNYTDGGLGHQRYRYTVYAYNTNGESDSSNGVSIWVGAPLAAPTNLQATGVDIHTINLSWASNAPNAVLSTIERSAVSATAGFAVAGTSASSTYTDTTCSPQTTYWYRVCQTDSLNVVSPYSNVAGTATTNAVFPPSGLTVSWTGSAFLVSWTATTTPGVTYAVARRRNGSTVSSTIASGITTVSYSDTTADTGIIYYFSVRAVAASGNYASAWSAECRGSSVLVYTERENNGPSSFSQNFWYRSGELLRGYDFLELSGTYSDSSAIYDSTLSADCDHDIFRISLTPNQKIRFQPVSGNVDSSGGITVTLCWVFYYTTSGVYVEEDVHDFAAAGETHTLKNPDWDKTFSESYLRVSIPAGITGADYDFIFEITR